MLQLSLGSIERYDLEEYNSKYATLELKVFFSDSLARRYQPIIYEGNVPANSDDKNSTNAEGAYYRIVYNPNSNEICIQYFVYWLMQDCTGFVGISNHKYDYEPIYIFIRPSNLQPVGIVNSGASSNPVTVLECRFHKTEIRRQEYIARDEIEESCVFTTSPSPFYPFGGSTGQKAMNCIKRYPIAGTIYFENCTPLFGIYACYHVFSGAQDVLKGNRLDIPLRQLDDKVLEEWYWKHHNSPDEEPFGHDVSNPFEFPFIKYFDPKPFLRENDDNRDLEK